MVLALGVSVAATGPRLTASTFPCGPRSRPKRVALAVGELGVLVAFLKVGKLVLALRKLLQQWGWVGAAVRARGG